VRLRKIKATAESEPRENASAAFGENSGVSRRVEDVVTPEMVAAGKLAIDESSGNRKHSLEDSIGEIYVAMAEKDQVAIHEKEDIAQVKHGKRAITWLYCGVIAMVMLACALITMIVIARLA
jgi:hypothetical protein